ncbi:MAG: lamin tail domain-containing protein [Actinomycetota bacterium]
MACALTAVITLGAITATTPPADAGTIDVVLSEVMYHAADGTTDDDDDYDYIELTNRSGSPIDLLGWSLDDAVEFVFEESYVLGPGEYVVIAEDASTFEERYGSPPAGVWDGKLKNSSELIELRAPDSTLADVLEYDDDPPWPGAADGDGRSLERVDLTLPNTGDDRDVVNWLASLDEDGTPGEANSAIFSGPVIFSVDDGDERPPAGADIPISAEISANADVVTLRYLVGFGEVAEITMADDDASVGGAGDGTYTALVPAQVARSLVRYEVVAGNDSGTTTSPSVTDTIDYHGLVVADPNEPTDIPVLDYFITEADYELLLGANRFTDNTSPIVVAHGDTVVDNATIRVRGNATRSLPKPSMRIELPNGHLISFGDRTEEPVDEFNLFWRNDLKADVGWEIAEELGFPRVDFFGLRVFRNGTFWGTGAYLTALDGRWRDAVGYDDAAVYKGARLMRADPTPEATANRFEKKEGAEGDFTDIWELSNIVIDNDSDEQFRQLMETLDVPAVINYWAFVSFLNQVNSDRKNFYLIRDPEGTGRWRVDPWDLNLPLGSPNLWTNGMPLIDQLNEYEVFREMHARRLRTMIDSYSAEELIQRFDDKFAVAVESFDEDQAIWRKGHSSTKFRSTWVEGAAKRYEEFADNTDRRGRSLPVSQSDDRPIEISGVTAAQGDLPAIVEVTNLSADESFDLTGWSIDEIDLTITDGTVLLPGATVAFTTDDVAFRQATDGAFAAGEFDELPDERLFTLTDAAGQVVSVLVDDPDLDDDGVVNEVDNCPADANPDQGDADADGIGDVCDPSPDGSTVVVPGLDGIRPTVSVVVEPERISVSWSSVVGASDYQFRYRAWRRAWIKDSPDLTFGRIIESTSDGTPYTIQVRAKVGGMWRPWTQAIVVGEGA